VKDDPKFTYRAQSYLSHKIASRFSRSRGIRPSGRYCECNAKHIQAVAWQSSSGKETSRGLAEENSTLPVNLGSNMALKTGDARLSMCDDSLSERY